MPATYGIGFTFLSCLLSNYAGYLFISVAHILVFDVHGISVCVCVRVRVI